MEHNERKSWQNPEGFWMVRTEADCEGRSMRTLGIFKGNYADIALALAKKSAYALHFSRIWEEDMILDASNTEDVKVSVAFDDASYLMDKNILKKEVEGAVGDRCIVSAEGYGHVQLFKPPYEDFVRMQALEKIRGILSPSEMEALGIYE